jgi:preprotein translocase subunit SecY
MFSGSRNCGKGSFSPLGMLVVFRLGTVIPIPGINVNALKLYFLSPAGIKYDRIHRVYRFLRRWGFHEFSVFMLGIMPYITMSIIMSPSPDRIPSLKKMAEERRRPEEDPAD